MDASVDIRPITTRFRPEGAQEELKEPMHTLTVDPPFVPASVTGSHA